MPFRWISDFYEVLQRRTAPLHVPVLSTTSVVRRFEHVSIMFVFRIHVLAAPISCSALGAAPHRGRTCALRSVQSVQSGACAPLPGPQTPQVTSVITSRASLLNCTPLQGLLGRLASEMSYRDTPERIASGTLCIAVGAYLSDQVCRSIVWEWREAACPFGGSPALDSTPCTERSRLKV